MTPRKRSSLSKELSRSELNSRNTKAGKAGQDITALFLKANGFDNVWPIATPTIPIFGKDPTTGRRVIRDLIYAEKAPGDIWCMKEGRSVLVEVKTSSTDRIPWSELADHQVRNLNDQVAKKGMGILSVVLNDTAHLCVWPVPGFGPGRSIVLRAGKLGVA